MPLVHSGNAPAEGGFFLIGQICGPICLIEGDDAQTLIIFTSLLDFAGPRARHFFCALAQDLALPISRDANQPHHMRLMSIILAMFLSLPASTSADQNHRQHLSDQISELAFFEPDPDLISAHRLQSEFPNPILSTTSLTIVGCTATFQNILSDVTIWSEYCFDLSDVQFSQPPEVFASPFATPERNDTYGLLNVERTAIGWHRFTPLESADFSTTHPETWQKSEILQLYGLGLLFPNSPSHVRLLALSTSLRVYQIRYCLPTS